MNKGSTMSRCLGAIVGALMLLAATPSSAQQSSVGQRATDGTPINRGQSKGTVARQPVKPLAAKTSNSADRSMPREPVAATARDTWTIEDALLTPRSKPLKAEPPEPAKPQLGRIQFDTGSIGVETEAKLKENRFSDGRTVPGLETVKREQPSYFGLSLSVPTQNNSFFPLPLTPHGKE